MNEKSKNDLQLAEASFSFLESEFGMVKVFANSLNDAWQIRYESHNIYVVCDQMPPGFEFDLRFGRKSQDEEPNGIPLTVADLLQNDPKNWDWSRESSTIAAYAHILHTLGSSVLRAEEADIEALVVERWRRWDAWRKSEKLKELRANADDLWRQKKYSEFIQVAAEIGEQRTPLETQRFLFAQKRVKV